MKRLRNSAKAVVLRDGRLLALQKKDAHGVYYVLPGGGQRPGETLRQALQRECLEEIGAAIEVGVLRFVREYIGRHHEFADLHRKRHQVEFIFEAHLRGDDAPAKGEDPDRRQIGLEWIPLDRIEQYPLYPAVLKDLLQAEPGGESPVYLGDVN